MKLVLLLFVIALCKDDVKIMDQLKMKNAWRDGTLTQEDVIAAANAGTLDREWLANTTKFLGISGESSEEYRKNLNKTLEENRPNLMKRGQGYQSIAVFNLQSPAIVVTRTRSDISVIQEKPITRYTMNIVWVSYPGAYYIVAAAEIGIKSDSSGNFYRFMNMTIYNGDVNGSPVPGATYVKNGNKIDMSLPVSLETVKSPNSDQVAIYGYTLPPAYTLTSYGIPIGWLTFSMQSSIGSVKVEAYVQSAGCTSYPVVPINEVNFLNMRIFNGGTPEYHMGWSGSMYQDTTCGLRTSSAIGDDGIYNKLWSYAQPP